MSFDGHAIWSVLLKKPALHVLNRQPLKKPFWPFQDHHWFLPLQGIWLRFGSFFGHGPSLTAETRAGEYHVPPMAILIDGSTKVLCQGITGSAGAFHTKGCLDYGTSMVGGVLPEKVASKTPMACPFSTPSPMPWKPPAPPLRCCSSPTLRRRWHFGSRDGWSGSDLCHHRGHSVADMVRTREILDRDHPELSSLVPTAPA